MEMLPSRFKRSAVNDALKRFRDGKSVGEILADGQKALYGCRWTKLPDEKIKMAKSEIAKDNATATNSIRKLAMRVKLSSGRTHDIVKRVLKPQAF